MNKSPVVIESAGDRSKQTEMLWKKLDAFPGLPVLSGQLAHELLSNERTREFGLDHLVSAVAIDDGLQQSVVAACRCAHDSLHDSDLDLAHGAAMIGFRGSARLIIAVQICGLLCDESAALAESGTQSAADDHFDESGFWLHAIAVATTAKHLASHRTGRGISVTPSDAFLAGLLSGLGRFVLAMIAPRGYAWSTRLAVRFGLDASTAETRFLGVDGGAVGGRLARRWGLPEDISACMSACGLPIDHAAPHAELVCLVALAKWLCRRYHLGWSGDWSDVGDGDALLANFGLTSAKIDSMMPDIVSETARSASLLGLCGRGFAPDRMPLMIADQANRTLDALVRRGGGGSMESGTPTNHPLGSKSVAA